MSLFGTGVTRVAVPLFALLTLNASSFDLGVLAAAGYLAWLVVALPAGALLESRPLRPVMVISDLSCAVALLSIPVAAGFAHVPLVQLFMVALIVGVATVLGDIAGQAFLPEVVARSELITANSLLQTSESIANAAGPALGGVLVRLVGATWAICADVISYAISIAAVMSVHAGRAATGLGQPNAPRAGVWERIRVGLRYAATDRVLRTLALLATALNFLNGAFDTLVIPFLVRTVRVPTASVGLLLGSGAAGAVLGAYFAPRMVRLFGGPVRTMLTLAVAAPIAAFLVPMSVPGPGLILFLAGYLMRDLTIAAMSLLARSYRQMTVPAELLARTTASIKVVSWGVLPFGAIFGGSGIEARSGCLPACC